MLERIGYSALLLRECLGLYVGVLRGRERLDLDRFSRDAYELSIGVLLPVSLIAAVVGLILGIQTDTVLASVNVPELAARLVAHAVVTEFAPLLIGLLVAARGGVALATRIAHMVSRGEIDGLLLSGVNPIHFTVGATLLAMLVASFALGLWAQAVMLGFAALWLNLSLALPAATFIDVLGTTIGPADLLWSVAKTQLFALLVALIAAREGATVSRRADAISQAATRTMLQAIGIILISDLLFAGLRA